MHHLAAGAKIRSDDKPSSSTVPETSSSTLYKPFTELIDGLFVPPNNPKKLNKLVLKQLKNTTGWNWYIQICMGVQSPLLLTLIVLILTEFCDADLGVFFR